MLWFRLFRESLSFAWQAILVNRLRTLLSLLGVMVGIFVISAVFTVVTSLLHLTLAFWAGLLARRRRGEERSEGRGAARA